MENIQKVREGLDLSRRELANRSGLALTTIYRIESGTSGFKVRYETAELLAKALGAEVEDLFTEDDLSGRGRPPQTNCTLERSTGLSQVFCPHCYISTNASLTVCTNCEAVLAA